MLNAAIRESMIEEVYERYLIQYPELLVYYNETQLQHIKQDTMHHLEHLESTWPMKMDSIFLDYVDWVDSVLTSRGIETKLLIDCFVWMKDVFARVSEQNEELNYYVYLLEEAKERLQNEKSV